MRQLSPMCSIDFHNRAPQGRRAYHHTYAYDDYAWRLARAAELYILPVFSLRSMRALAHA